MIDKEMAVRDILTLLRLMGASDYATIDLGSRRWIDWVLSRTTAQTSVREFQDNKD